MSQLADDVDTDLKADGQRIEALLRDLRGLAGPETWPRIDELVQRLVRLYGAGLLRILEHARGATGPDDLQTRICADALVSGLLLVHDAHPESAGERVQRTIDRLQPHLGRHAVEAVGIDHGALTLRLLSPCIGCSTPHVAIEELLREALGESAPELHRIEIQGLATDPPKTTLVTLNVPNAATRAS